MDLKTGLIKPNWFFLIWGKIWPGHEIHLQAPRMHCAAKDLFSEARKALIASVYSGMIPFHKDMINILGFLYSSVTGFYNPKIFLDEEERAGALILFVNSATAGRTLLGWKPMFLACNYAARSQLQFCFSLFFLFNDRSGLWRLQSQSNSEPLNKICESTHGVSSTCCEYIM